MEDEALSLMVFLQPHFYRGALRENPSSHLGDKTCCFLEKHCCSKYKGSFPRPKPEPRYPAPLSSSSQKDHCRGHQLFKGLGPAGGLAAGGASPFRQEDHWLLISSGTLSRDSPPPASIPARLLLLLPTQRMSPHSAPGWQKLSAAESIASCGGRGL